MSHARTRSFRAVSFQQIPWILPRRNSGRGLTIRNFGSCPLDRRPLPHPRASCPMLHPQRHNHPLPRVPQLRVLRLPRLTQQPMLPRVGRHDLTRRHAWFRAGLPSHINRGSEFNIQPGKPGNTPNALCGSVDAAVVENDCDLPMPSVAVLPPAQDAFASGDGFFGWAGVVVSVVQGVSRLVTSMVTCRCVNAGTALWCRRSEESKPRVARTPSIQLPYQMPCPQSCGKTSHLRGVDVTRLTG